MLHGNPDPLQLLIFALICAYLWAIRALMLTLKRQHTALWQSFGWRGADPTGPIDSVRFVRTGIYAIFQGGYRSLDDPRVDFLVFAIRTLFVVIGTLIVIGKASGRM